MSERGKIPAQEYTRVEQAQKALDFLDTIEAKEVFKDDKSKLEFLKDIDPKEFLGLLTQINNLLRNKSIRNVISDGERVCLSGGFADDAHNFPKHADKFELLKEMLERVKYMKNTKEIGALVAGTITGVHPFLDGNGRVSRLMYYLISEPYSGNQQQKRCAAKLLNEDGREHVDIHPGLISQEIEQLMWRELGYTEETDRIVRGIKDLNARPAIFTNECTKDDLQDIKTVFGDQEAWGFYAVYSFLKSRGKLNDYLLHFYDKKNGELQRSRIDGNKVASDLTVAEIKEVIKIYYALKADFIRKFIDIIASEPKKYPLLDDPNGTIKEKFLKKLTIDIEP